MKTTPIVLKRSPASSGASVRAIWLLAAIGVTGLLLSACKSPEIITTDRGPSSSERQVFGQQPVPQDEPRSRYGNPEFYEVDDRVYRVMDSAYGYLEQGVASWYGKKFHGRRTSSGEIYDMYQFTAAHKTLPLPVYALVTNLDNGKHVIVKINDRGPFVKDRLIDLSYAAAKELEIIEKGTGRVEVKVISHQTPPPQATAVASNNNAADDQRLATNSNLFVQVGAFSDRSRAEDLAAALDGKYSHPVQISPTTRADGLRLYRVRFGPLASGTVAERLLAVLKEQNFTTPKVVSE